MGSNTSFFIPQESRNFVHDFRIAIFSFLRPYTDVAEFNYSSADIIIYPSAVTMVDFNTSVVNGSIGGGSFEILAGLEGEIKLGGIGSKIVDDKGRILAETPDDEKLRNKIGSFSFGSKKQDNLTNDIGSLFSNVNSVIRPMDYVAIFTQDVATNVWWQNAESIETATPKYVGLISRVSINDVVVANKMSYRVEFKSLMRLLELGRYATEKTIYPVLQKITGKDFGEYAQNVFLGAKNIFSNNKPNEIITSVIKPWYPSEAIGNRIELDTMRGEAQSLNWENFVYSSLQGNFNYDTIYNKLRQLASNKDFEFYADEDGQIVWKLPTYARGINRKNDNKVSQIEFDPQNYERDDRTTIYHLHDLISGSINCSEGEIVNIISGPNDMTVNGLDSSQTNALLSQFRYTYYIKGGPNSIDPSERLFGFLDVGIRPVTLQNPVFYNWFSEKQQTFYGQPVTTDIFSSSLMYWAARAWKLNLSRYYTASVTMIDNPRLKVGMPCVIPRYARVGDESNKGLVLPSIFYISAITRRYQAGALPIMSLSLTHGRFINEEHHNGIHLFGSLSSWWARAEGATSQEDGGLFEEVLQRDPQNLFTGSNDVNSTIGVSLETLNFTKNDTKINEVVTEQKDAYKTAPGNLREDFQSRSTTE